MIYWDNYGDEVDPDCDINDVNDYNEWHTEPMAADIERLLNESYDYIILDYPFGYLNDCAGKYIDLTVFIDTPLDVALARRIRRDYTSRSKESDFGLGDIDEISLKAIDEELHWYLTRSRPTYAKFTEMHKPTSDLIVDGMKTPEEIIGEIMSFIGTRRHYDALIDENNDPVHDPEPLKAYMNKWDGELFIEAMRLTAVKSVLEIGVGTGRLAERVCKRCGSFTGIDISTKTVERAGENLRNYQNTRLICGDFLTYTFTETFDVIYSSLTFMHIKDKQTAIQKAACLLNLDGRFVLSVGKDQRTAIDFGDRQIEVYPDTAEETASLLIKSELSIEKRFETEFAVIFAANT